MKTLTKSKPAKKPAAKVRQPARSAKRLPTVFTVRDMNRDTAAVLNAVRQHGKVMIRSRSGEQFKVEVVKSVEPAGPLPDFAARMRLHRERLKTLGYVPPSAGGWEAISRAIAGEV